MTKVLCYLLQTSLYLRQLLKTGEDEAGSRIATFKTVKCKTVNHNRYESV
jgi:hypothetical protein